MIPRAALQKLITEGKLREIFIDHLGWDGAADLIPGVEINFAGEKHTFSAAAIAQKRGFMVCSIDCEEMPLRAVRRKAEEKLMRAHHEHLLVWRATGEQIWMYAVKRPGKPARFVEVSAKQPKLVVEKLQGLVFSIAEEDGLGIVDVVGRVGAAFVQNAEKVTRRFYTRFRSELNNLTDFIEGIAEKVQREHYASLMLNRLMFIYFIQKQGYLNDEKDYLSNRLAAVQQMRGENKFYATFYRYFLKALFHRLGVPKAEQSPEIEQLIGKVPYLNGGLFDEHQIEKKHSGLDIPDDLFKRIFDFFDRYQWYLDERPSAVENEINPDVIGYIFEKYINDRAKMGAYYTKEDITDYIAQHTILPALLQKTKKECPAAFSPKSGAGTVWKLLKENPDDYIYESARKGCEKPDSELPENIRRGLDENACNLLERRADWNKPAGEEFALTGETWRECIARRARYFALKAKIQSGGIADIAGLTTYNLDIKKLISDMIAYAKPEFVFGLYFSVAGRRRLEGANIKERRGITVLDPACGSGAFLFAALNVLQPVYSDCTERLDKLANDKKMSKQQREEYRKSLGGDGTQSRNYWIFRNIILHNLFGVDIMPEAAEVAKLRLFLKLAAVSEMDAEQDNRGLKPLPDIDFNIRAGNSLLGFSSMAEFKRDANTRIKLNSELVKEVENSAENAGMAYGRFIDDQDKGSDDFKTAKAELAKRSENLNDKLNEYLALIHDVQYQEDARPFHWFADFYGIVEKSGGFDVVIGNPPYVEAAKTDYPLVGFSSAKGNLYAYMLEKSVQSLREDGALGMIVPISLPSTQRMGKTRDMLRKRFSFLCAANFADRPGTLFNGVHQKTAIVLGFGGGREGFYTTNYLHWSNKTERDSLFAGLHYRENENAFDKWGKFGNDIERGIWQKLYKTKSIPCFRRKPTTNRNLFYINSRLMFWVKSCISLKEPIGYLPYTPLNDIPREAVVAMLNSNIYFWFWEVVGDGWNLTRYELDNFRFGVRAEDIKALAALGEELEADLEKKKRYVGTVQTEYEYVHSQSKNIIDEIDKILAKHYGFTDAELDYIINYAYKYRMSGADD